MVLSHKTTKSIGVSSDNITSVITDPTEYNEIKIKLTKNCCTQEYLDTIQVSKVNKWYVNILKQNGDRYSLLKSLYFKNYDTGETFRVPLDEFPLAIVDCEDLVLLTEILNTYFNLNFPLTEDLEEDSDSESSSASDSDSDSDEPENREIISTCDESGDTNMVYSISHLPDNIFPLYLEYEFDDAPIMEQFYSSYSLKNSLLTTSDVMITPEIMGLEKFTDGVYTVQTTIIKNSGTQIVETQCFFLDCETKCKTFELVANTEDEDEKTTILMLHYGLTVGSNCACQCDELCNIYANLAKRLDTEEETCNCG